MEVCVLRLGHRPARDKRVTTHLGLVARAFGADEIVICGARDEGVVESLRGVVKRWGGRFKARVGEAWRREISKYRKRGFSIVHLTMYGMPVQRAIGKIKRKQKILVVVGGEKVPYEVYEIADFNVSITSQPHSEIAALSIFLDRLFGGREMEKKYEGGEVEIVPKARGKHVLRKRGKGE